MSEVLLSIDVLEARHLFSVQDKPKAGKKPPAKKGAPEKRELSLAPPRTQITIAFPGQSLVESPIFDANVAPNYLFNHRITVPKDESLFDTLASSSVTITVDEIEESTGKKLKLGHVQFPLAQFLTGITSSSLWNALSVPEDIIQALAEDPAAVLPAPDASAGSHGILLPGNRPTPEIQCSIKIGLVIPDDANNVVPVLSEDEQKENVTAHVRISGVYAVPASFASQDVSPRFQYGLAYSFPLSAQQTKHVESWKGNLLVLPAEQVQALSEGHYTLDSSSPGSISNIAFEYERVHYLVASAADSWRASIQAGIELELEMFRSESAAAAEDPSQIDAIRAIARIPLNRLVKPGALSFSGIFPVSLDTRFAPASEDSAQAQDIFGLYRTFVKIDITVSRPLVARVIRPKLHVSEILPKRPAPPVNSHLPEASFEYRSTLRKAFIQLYSEYVNLTQHQSHGQLDVNATPEQRRQQFFYHLNSSGIYQHLRDGLRGPIVNVLREKFHKSAQQTEQQQAQARNRILGVSADSEEKNANENKEKDNKDDVLSELYTYLADELHRSLSQFRQSIQERTSAQALHAASLSSSSTNPLSPINSSFSLTSTQAPILDDEVAKAKNSVNASRNQAKILQDKLSQFKRQADEAERSGDAATAGVKLQDRLVLAPKDANVWYDYGVFCLRQQDIDRASSCLKEALSFQANHVPSLLAHACLCLQNKDLDRAEVFSRSAVEADPQNPLAVTIQGLFFFFAEEDADSLSAYERSAACFSDLCQDSIISKTFASCLASTITESAGDESVFILTARYLNSLHFTHLAQLLIDQDSRSNISSSSSISRDVEISKIHSLQHDLPRAEAVLAPYAEKDAEDLKHPYLFNSIGHINFEQERYEDARVAYEKHVEACPSSTDIETWSRLARIHLHFEQFAEAKDAYLRGCRALSAAHGGIAPASFWLGAGIASLRLQNYEDAERALAEANIQDNTNPVVWGYLTVLCLVTDREGEAEQSLTQAIKLGLRNAQLFYEIGNLYFKMGKRSHAEAALRRALTIEDAPAVRMLLGNVLESQNLLEEAQVEYQAAQQAQA